MSSHDKSQSVASNELSDLYRAVMASSIGAVDYLEHFPQVSRVLQHEVRGLLGVRVGPRVEEGAGYWDLTRVRNDWVIILSSVFSQSPSDQVVPTDGLVHFNFELTGELSYRVSGPDALERSDPHVWRRTPVDEMTSTMTLERRSVSVGVRPDFLLEQLLPSHGELPPALQAVLSAPRQGDSTCRLPLTTQMLSIADKLFEGRYSGTLWLTYIEAMSLELLCFAVANFWSLSGRPGKQYTDRELRALSAARQALMTRQIRAPSLRQLARSVGLSEKALEHGFTTVYGERPTEFGRYFRRRAGCQSSGQAHPSA